MPDSPPGPPTTSFEREALIHLGEVHRYARSLAGDDTAAEDLVQDTYLLALRSWHTYQTGTNCRAWLYTIAHRKATDTVRVRARRPTTVALDGLTPAAEPSTAPAPLADDGLWSAVRELPAKQRAAVVHRYVLDLDYRQIAERMGTSEDAARQNVSAGLRRLRVEVDR